jgi:hypothetical protein
MADDKKKSKKPVKELKMKKAEEKKSLNLEWINEWFTELLLNTDIIF